MQRIVRTLVVSATHHTMYAIDKVPLAPDMTTIAVDSVVVANHNKIIAVDFLVIAVQDGTALGDNAHYGQLKNEPVCF